MGGERDREGEGAREERNGNLVLLYLQRTRPALHMLGRGSTYDSIEDLFELVFINQRGKGKCSSRSIVVEPSSHSSRRRHFPTRLLFPFLTPYQHSANLDISQHLVLDHYHLPHFCNSRSCHSKHLARRPARNESKNLHDHHLPSSPLPTPILFRHHGILNLILTPAAPPPHP